MTTLPSRPRRASVPLRAWAFPLLLVAASCALAALERDPQDDVDGLVALAARDTRGRSFYHHEKAALGVLGDRGWTLTLYVGDTRRFAPAVYLVLTRVDGHLRGELILDEVRPTGRIDQVELGPQALEAYLARATLDLRGLDQVVAARRRP